MKSQFEHWGRKYFVGRRVTPQAHQHMQDSLMDEAELNIDYVVLILGACLIATLGLLANSAAVIIGAMLVAPLMLPIRSIAFGILEGDWVLMTTGAKSLGVGTGLAIALSLIIGLSSGFLQYGSEVAARSSPTLLDLGIAIAAGGISGYAKVQPKLSNTLAGTAIAVALMPPLCVVGLGLAQLSWPLTLGAALLYLTNLLGITLSCMVAFLLAGYSPLRRARRPLGAVILLTSVLVIPLGISLVQLVRQNQLEANVKRALLEETETFKNLQLVSSYTNWQLSPPEVHMAVNSSQPITPKQVQLLEAYINRRMNQSFRFVFQVSEIQEVTREDSGLSTEPLPNFGREESPSLKRHTEVQ
ncbi:MAG: DUF389 domain-containing protein [Phormidesmis sp. RL_2_1]|nr:DUF389 domain-containing protein [Phormidesmis sp. RL_2_1]